jgi:hypothetical protein
MMAAQAALIVGVLAAGVLVSSSWGVHSNLSLKFNQVKALVQDTEFPYTVTSPASGQSYPRSFTADEEGCPTVWYDRSWEEKLDNIFNWRLFQYKHMAHHFSFWGHGYNINVFDFYFVHNVPAIVADQVGVIAALAWCWVTLFCLVRTRWKYAFAAVIALSLFDHFIWTQAAPWWWALVGVASADATRNDLIFRRSPCGP